MGCGVDLVELARFQQAVKRGGERFLARVFTPTERRYVRGRHGEMASLAARFAVKEAVVKALAQVDPTLVLALKQIEVRNDQLGRPSIFLPRKTNLADRFAIHVSLSHTEHLAVASAIVMRA